MMHMMMQQAQGEGQEQQVEASREEEEQQQQQQQQQQQEGENVGWETSGLAGGEAVKADVGLGAEESVSESTAVVVTENTDDAQVTAAGTSEHRLAQEPMEDLAAIRVGGKGKGGGKGNAKE